jgi:hypothetical protein
MRESSVRRQPPKRSKASLEFGVTTRVVLERHSQIHASAAATITHGETGTIEGLHTRLFAGS